MFTKTITIFNKWFNKETRQDEYIRAVIENVYCDSTESIKVQGQGVVSSDATTVIIPSSNARMKDYVSPREYQELSKEQAIKKWTLENEDVLVEEKIEADIKSITELKNYKIKKITSISIRDKCFVEKLNHIEVIAN